MRSGFSPCAIPKASRLNARQSNSAGRLKCFPVGATFPNRDSAKVLSLPRLRASTYQLPCWLVSDRGAFLVAQEIEVAGERARAHLQLPAKVAAVGQPSAGHAFPHHRDDAAQAVILGTVLRGFGAHFFL